MLILLPSTFCQNSVQSQSTTNFSEPERWNLDKYVYSHTHYKTGAKDKPLIDFDAIDNWQGLDEGVTINDDGKYFAYKLIRGRGVAVYNRKKPDSLIIQSTSGSWRYSYAGSAPGFFSSHSGQYIFKNKYALNFIKLGKNQVRVVDGVSSYKTKNSGKNQWLAYQLKEGNSNLVVVNLVTGKERRFSKVASYGFDESGKWLTCKLDNDNENLLIYNLETGDEKRFPFVESFSFDQSGNKLLYKALKVNGRDSLFALNHCNLLNNDTKTIWESSSKDKGRVTNFIFDHSGRQLLYVLSTGATPDQTNYSIWYYHESMSGPVIKVDNQTKGMKQNFLLQGDASFSDNDQYIRFSTSKKEEKPELLPDPVSLDVWSSQDKVLQSTQSYLDKQTFTYTSVISVNNGSVITLENESEKLYELKGDFALVKKSGESIYGDRFWEKDYDKDSNFLISLKDGVKHNLPTRGGLYTLWFSPDNRYLIYFDAEKGSHYFSYDLHTGVTKKISIGVADGLLGSNFSFLITDEMPSWPAGIAGWLDDGRSLLVYDNYDIWQLDLLGEKPAINITNGYGEAHNLYFGLLNSVRGNPTPIKIQKKDPLYLCAFSGETKENGFYQGSLNKASNPRSLYIGQCFFWGQFISVGASMRPVKAKSADTWIVMKQTPTDAPNYFVTKDFKDYKRLTDVQPQRDYNWLTTKLINFKQLDGTQSQGVLYVPENFDSTKKYPVIISFYASLSNCLYQYPTPAYLSATDIYNDPAWMVSHGYLVFTPDIYFKKSEWGPSTVSAIDGAARYLKTLPYVDSNHLAATGHSNSGRFGYYLLTHSHSFAAMSIGSGATNIIGLGLSLDGQNRNSSLEWAEKTAFGAGGLGNLWENKERWIDHTAVLQADKATAPLLLFHCNDDGVPVRMAIELYTAFRRLEKPVWWLQYDKGSHRLTNLEDLRDFTIRYTQFYDHYLKGTPAPGWMTQGIPSSLKTIESRFELDPTGSCALRGKECPVCDAWNRQYKRTPQMFTKSVAEWKLGDELLKQIGKEKVKK
jgi:dienelactone hydrolase